LQGGNLFHQQPGLREHATGGGAGVGSALPPCQFSTASGRPHARAAFLRRIHPTNRQALMMGLTTGQRTAAEHIIIIHGAMPCSLVQVPLRPPNGAVAAQGPGRGMASQTAGRPGRQVSTAKRLGDLTDGRLVCLHPNALSPHRPSIHAINRDGETRFSDRFP
jgi:hypothetical protein